MRIALVGPWNPKETAIAQNQIDFYKCICDYIDIDFYSDTKVEVDGVSIKKIEINDMKKYDIIHFQWGNNPLHFFEYTFMKKMKLLGLNIPIVSTIHDVDLQYLIRLHKNGRSSRYYLAIRYFTNIYKDLLKNKKIPDILTALDIVKNSDITIVNSNYAKDRIIQDLSGFNFDKDKIVTMKLGIESKKFDISKEEAEKRIELKLPEGKKILLYVGYLHTIKSVDLVIKALYYIKEFAKRNDFFFLVIGDGPDKPRLQNLANKYIPENSAFMGFLYPEYTIPYYKVADIVINPRRFSRGEVSMVIPETFSAAKPIIAPDVGCNNEYVIDDRGYLANNDDELDYMDAILYFLEHPEEISRRGENARKFAAESLDWRSQAKMFIKQYEKAIDMHSNR